MREPRSAIRRRGVPARFKALFPPLPVLPVPRVSAVVPVSATRENTLTHTLRKSYQQVANEQLSPAADRPSLELSTPPLPVECSEEGLPDLPVSERAGIPSVSRTQSLKIDTLCLEGIYRQKAYRIFPAHLRAEKHTASGTKYRLIWSRLILREGQRWPDEHDRRLSCIVQKSANLVHAR